MLFLVCYLAYVLFFVQARATYAYENTQEITYNNCLIGYLDIQKKQYVFFNSSNQPLPLTDEAINNMKENIVHFQPCTSQYVYGLKQMSQDGEYICACLDANAPIAEIALFIQNTNLNNHLRKSLDYILKEVTVFENVLNEESQNTLRFTILEYLRVLITDLCSSKNDKYYVDYDKLVFEGFLQHLKEYCDRIHSKNDVKISIQEHYYKSDRLSVEPKVIALHVCLCILLSIALYNKYKYTSSKMINPRIYAHFTKIAFIFLGYEIFFLYSISASLMFIDERARLAIERMFERSLDVYKEQYAKDNVTYTTSSIIDNSSWYKEDY